MRIGINIPNELMRRLEPLKPELNISQVCRDALEAKAKSHEQMLARLNDDGIKSAVDQAWEQEKEFLAAIEFDWEMLGYEDAESWVKAASWDDWDDLMLDIEVYEERNRPAWDFVPPIIDGVKWFTNRRGELHDHMEQARKQNSRFYLSTFLPLASQKADRKRLQNHAAGVHDRLAEIHQSSLGSGPRKGAGVS